MNKKDYFDNVIKVTIDDSVSNIQPSRDIFNDAWNKKEKEMSKRKYLNMKYMKKVVLVPACCVAFALVGVFTFSPGARVAAQEAFKTIFLPDESGNIVEKSDDTPIPVTVGPIKITDENKETIERSIGFKINLPEKIGNYSYKKIGDFIFAPSVTITADAVKYKDSDKVMEKVFEELEKDYKLGRMVSALYEDNEGHKFQLMPKKDTGNSKKYDEDVFKVVSIDNIKYTVKKNTKINYDVKEDEDGNGVTDLEHKPTSTEELYYLNWNYDGVNYGLAIGNNSSDIDAAIDFVKDYIKILKQK